MENSQMALYKRMNLIYSIGLLSTNALADAVYLKSDITLDCGSNDSNQVRAISADTQHSTYMRAGDTLWVGAKAHVEYQPSSDNYNKELVGTYLMCGHETQPTTDIDYSQVQSRSGGNHWKIQGHGSRIATTHITKAVYTAEQEGMHTCWMIYMCKPKSGHSLAFKQDETFLTYYSVNQFPGINWIPDGDHLVNSTSKHTPGGSKIWDAGTSTESDSEVVVYWSPRMTNCTESDAQCGPDFKGYDADTYFDWRIVVYQYNEDKVCNKNFGSWNNNNICRHHDHHCDYTTYRDEFPIITGNGTEGFCGESSVHRKFKVYTQIRKSSDDVSDIMIHNSATGRSNFMIYSR